MKYLQIFLISISVAACVSSMKLPAPQDSKLQEEENCFLMKPSEEMAAPAAAVIRPATISLLTPHLLPHCLPTILFLLLSSILI